MHYPVNSIKYTIQGEGFHIGTPTVFVELAGCGNNKPESTMMCEIEIRDRVNRLCKDITLIVVTTPTENPTVYDLQPLMEELNWHSTATTAIETTGTDAEQIEHLQEREIAQWITLVPKHGVEMDEDCFRCASEIIFTIEDGDNPLPFTELVTMHLGVGMVYVRPKTNEDYQYVIDFIKNNPQWRISPVRSQAI